MGKCTWSPALTVRPIHRSFVSPCRHVTRRSYHRATIPPCHLLHRPIVPPATTMPPPCHCATWCATVTPRCHHAAVPPPYRHDTWAYLSKPTHQAYFTTSNGCKSYLLTFWHWHNFTIWPVAKNSLDYFYGCSRRTMGFPINISQYCAIRKSKITDNEEMNGWRKWSWFRWMLHDNVWFMNCMNTTYFFILGLSNFSVNGLSDLDKLDEFKSITINHSSDFT